MRKYKIVQTGEDTFYAYCKGLLTWKCLNPPSWWEGYDSVNSYKEAQQLIEDHKTYPKEFHIDSN
jgi:hypothetical protein